MRTNTKTTLAGSQLLASESVPELLTESVPESLPESDNNNWEKVTMTEHAVRTTYTCTSCTLSITCVG